MASAANCPSLRSGFHRRAGRPRLDERIPRIGAERGLVADLGPPAGKALARQPFRTRRLPDLGHPGKRGSPGARTLLTMSLIFSWFGV